ncbi:uncharacterized protein TNCV_400221 [Trichonephila clavipes]|nr:uncharacterized protein TNCV_400221 [Trichonephila clavipes]
MDAETAPVLRGRAKATLTRTINFIDKNDQTFNKNDIRNKGLLLSEPANIIKHIPITETAYNETWEKLLARYDKKKQIIFSLIKTFMEQPSFNDTNSHNLRNIADTSDEVIKGLKSIDTKAESRDVWLIYILLQKVDPKTRQEWAQFSNNIDFPHLEHL